MQRQPDTSRDGAHQEQELYLATVQAMHGLSDGLANDVASVAAKVGVDKLLLIGWARVDIGFARLLASKLTDNPFDSR